MFGSVEDGGLGEKWSGKMEKEEGEEEEEDYRCWTKPQTYTLN